MLRGEPSLQRMPLAELLAAGTEALAELDELRLHALRDHALALGSELPAGAATLLDFQAAIGGVAELRARMRVFAAVLEATGQHLARRTRDLAARTARAEGVPQWGR